MIKINKVSFSLLICAVSFAVLCMLSVPAGAVSLSRKDVTITKGYTATITAEDAEGEVEWSSSDRSVAEVKDGKIKAISAGEAVITAKADGSTLECSVTVLNGRLTPSEKKVEIVKGTSSTITLKAYGSHGLKLSVSDKKIASVSWVKPWNGDSIGIKITGKHSGTAKIRVSMTKHPEVYTVITVKVLPRQGAASTGTPAATKPESTGTVSSDSDYANNYPDSNYYPVNEVDENMVHHVGEYLGAESIPTEQGAPFNDGETQDGKKIELPVIVIEK